MRRVALQRLRKCSGWKLLVLTLLPVFVFIAFNVLDLDGSDAKAFWRHGLFAAEPEQDDSANNERGALVAAQPHEPLPSSIAVAAVDDLRLRVVTRGIRRPRILARRGVSDGTRRAEQPTADPA